MRRGSWIVVSLFSIGEGESFEDVSKIARESFPIDANWIVFFLVQTRLLQIFVL